MSISATDSTYDEDELENILNKYESNNWLNDECVEVTVHISDTEKELGVILEYDRDERFIGFDSVDENFFDSYQEIEDAVTDLEKDIGKRGYQVQVDENSLEEARKWARR